MKRTFLFFLSVILICSFCIAADDDDTKRRPKDLTIDELWKQAEVIVIAKEMKKGKKSSMKTVVIENVLRGKHGLKELQIKLNNWDNVKDGSKGLLFLKKDKKKDHYTLLPSEPSVHDPENDKHKLKVLTELVSHWKNV